MSTMAPTADLHTDVQRFFDDFVTAFSAFDGQRIAQRYAVPYAAVDAQGTWRRFASTGETGDYFHGVVTQYHLQGCRSCRFHSLEVLAIGPHGALATVTWELLREDASVLSAWRESYTLVRDADGRLAVAASVDHAG